VDKQNAVKVGMSMGEDKETRREESHTNKSAGGGGGGGSKLRGPGTTVYCCPTRGARRRRGICAYKGGKKAKAHNKERKSRDAKGQDASSQRNYDNSRLSFCRKLR